MSNMRVINSAVNVVMIVVTAYVLVHLWQQWRLRPLQSEPSSAGPLVELGSKLSLTEVSWRRDRTVVLIVSTTCRSCNDSRDFYRLLARHPSVKAEGGLVVLAPQTKETLDRWLADAGIPAAQALGGADLQSLGFDEVPALLLVADGTVTDIMIGKASAQRRAALLTRLEGGSAAIDDRIRVRTITESEALQSGILTSALVLDVRSRESYAAGHRPTAINIPHNELTERVPELKEGRAIVVDCVPPSSRGVCRLAAETVQRLGFDNVSTLVAPRSQ